jgi:hypothetical protein
MPGHAEGHSPAWAFRGHSDTEVLIEIIASIGNRAHAFQSNRHVCVRRP